MMKILVPAARREVAMMKILALAARKEAVMKILVIVWLVYLQIPQLQAEMLED